jgi:hypothetical protein
MMRSRNPLALVLFCAGCATLATEAGDDDAVRPNAHAGPFRLLRKDEVDTPDAPYVLKFKGSEFRDLTVLDLSAEDELGDSIGFAVASIATVPGIFRFVASDGRSFRETPEPKTPIVPGADVDAPEVARVGDEIWLFYSDAQGIERVRSNDGESFTKDPAPVLSTAGAPAWEGGKTPRAPGFVALDAGDYRLFYEANGRIGEARSSDGESWERIGDSPVLEPDSDAAAFDGASVGDPEPWVRVGAEGRRVTRVYYTGRAIDGTSELGLGARYGSSGRLQRAPAPAFSSTRSPFAPSIVPYRDFTLLFLTQRGEATADWPAVTVGIAPATFELVVK